MSDEANKNSAKSAVILAITVVVVAAYCVAFGLPTLVWLESKHMVSEDPWLLDVPKPLPQPSLSPVAQSNGAELRAYNYEFVAPWSAKSKLTPSLVDVEFRFDSGQVIVFFDPQTEVDTLSKLRATRLYLDIFGFQTIDSNYALYQAIYRASPARLSPFMRTNAALQMNQLISWKLSFGLDAEGGMSSFDLGTVRGFEFGDPATGRPVSIRFFDDRNHQFRFSFLVAGNSSAKITQDDIDVVVQSFQPVPLLER
jgi:hypothetical protein